MREKGNMLLALTAALIFLGAAGVQGAWGFSGTSVLLKDIEVLTLYSGKMTAGGRSSPVQQLECVKGGTAPCDAFRPRVVQCYNRGFDGVDVQWECKTDMDNAYRFGEVEVSCEGYSHRDDPYVLQGSCGLRYSLDYTKEGFNQKNTHDYYGSQDTGYGYSGSHQTYGSDKLSKASTFADLIVFVAVALMMYALYKTCVGSSRHTGQDAYSNTSDDYPAGGGGGGTGGGVGGGVGGSYGWFGQGAGHNPTAPPPPEYPDNASCRNRTAPGGGGTGGGSGGGGFWTGAAAGGLLGYMFGNRGNQHYGHHGGYQRPHGGGWFRSGGWGGSSGGFGGGGGGFGGGGGGSTGTRSASGFGGTGRR